MTPNARIGIIIIASAAVFAAVPACETPKDPVAAAVESMPPPTSSLPDAAAVAANELGLVPVLMYHQLTPSPVSEYDQTAAEFRLELERLYREGYRPVTAVDYISGRIDLPAGTHPVVLTFDDSTISQVRFADDGTLAPDTALGILTEFAARNPDFTPRATFYVNNEPFGSDPRTLPWLAEHGYEIGAHTATHANLASLDVVGVQRELAENVRAIESAAPRNDVRTMALPLGIFPTDHALAAGGNWDGTPYAFDAVMLVGAEPAPSPFSTIDPMGVPRIRSGKGEVAFDSAYWLDRLADHPDQRYTSDGDPTTVSFPKDLAGELSSLRSHRVNAY
ncbi:polysaccharide deacetylase family protein [Nocardia sp. NBC_01009]|uniref:polysaccharide deacetylase family protein n=1 Tax=Nocardia sp. NBC_01009 TaxID=2975996 RepID=UPI003865809B|nr:polysaccharide deacetylase family protein [Nocardia sp. NBC_01009]